MITKQSVGYGQPFRPKDSSELPEWFVIEAYHNNDSRDWNLRAGVRCRDGDLTIFDMPIYLNVNPGRSMTLTMCRREVLEEMQAFVATELAKIELEE